MNVARVVFRRHAGLVREVTNRTTYNVHAAIPLTDPGGDTLSDEFPTYVERDIDASLRERIADKSSTGGLVVLVGPAAAGKSRCLYEAIQAVLPDWRLRLPANGEAVNNLARSNRTPARSVIWLDELQTFFGAQPLTAATVRYLVAGRAGPVLLAATIRPEDIDAIAGPRTDIAHQMYTDAYQVVRMLARSSGRPGGSERAVRFDIGSKLSTDELERARRLAGDDPRIATALDGLAASLGHAGGMHNMAVIAERRADPEGVVSCWTTPPHTASRPSWRSTTSG
jgi:hypothetical protein